MALNARISMNKRRGDRRTSEHRFWLPGMDTGQSRVSPRSPSQTRKQINNNLFRAQVGGRTFKSYNLASIIKALNLGRHDTMLSPIVPFLANFKTYLYQPIVISDELFLTFSPVTDVLKNTLPIFKM